MDRKVAVLVFLLLALCGLVFAENALADDFFDDSTSDPVAATGTPLIIVGGKRSAPAARMMTMPKSLSSFNTQKPMQLTVPNSSNVYVDAHNAYRSKHRVPNLSWDASLASSAQAYSTKCQITHSMIPGIGENLAWNTKAEGAAASAIDGWYNEMSLYNYAAPQFSVATGVCCLLRSFWRFCSILPRWSGGQLRKLDVVPPFVLIWQKMEGRSRWLYVITTLKEMKSRPSPQMSRRKRKIKLYACTKLKKMHGDGSCTIATLQPDAFSLIKPILSSRYHTIAYVGGCYLFDFCRYWWRSHDHVLG